MRVIEGIEDKFGRCPLRVTGLKNLAELHEYLWHNYNGFKFAIVFDETKDEYEEYDKEILVYFLDELAGELASYADLNFTKKY